MLIFLFFIFFYLVPQGKNIKLLPMPGDTALAGAINNLFTIG